MKLSKSKLIFASIFCVYTATAHPQMSFQNHEQTLVADSKLVTETEFKNYKIDQAHTKLMFEVSHLVVSSVSGSFTKFSGTFQFDPNNFEKTTLDAVADIKSIDTGIQKRDDHLRSPDFFDAKKFPKMLLESTGVKKTGDNTFDLMTTMTMRDVSKPVVFHVTYKGKVVMMGTEVQAFKAETKINRQDFGIKFSKIVEAGPLVGDDVAITIVCEGNPDVVPVKKGKDKN